MPAEPMMQPGTFGSTGGTTTIYPLKSYQYLAASEALFFIVLTIVTIAPDSAMILSRFTVLVPDIIAVFTEPLFRIPFMIVAFVMDIVCIYSLIVRMQVKFILDGDGIFYSNRIYCIYSPWKNIVGFENIKYSIALLKGLTLNKEFQQGPTIEEGRQQGFPVFEYKKPVYAKRYPRAVAGKRFSLFPWTNTFPLMNMSNKKSVKKKLITAIGLYAPHILTYQGN